MVLKENILILSCTLISRKFGHCKSVLLSLISFCSEPHRTEVLDPLRYSPAWRAGFLDHVASLTFQAFTCAVPLAGNPLPTPWGQLPIVFWISSWLFPSWILLRMSGSGLGTTSLCSHSITSISLAPHPLLFYPYPSSRATFSHSLCLFHDAINCL